MFFKRNPLPGSAPARHLEPDALIFTRFGSLGGRISHKSCFFENAGAAFWPKMFRAQIVHGNLGQARKSLQGLPFISFATADTK